MAGDVVGPTAENDGGERYRYCTGSHTALRQAL